MAGFAAVLVTEDVRQTTTPPPAKRAGKATASAAGSSQTPWPEYSPRPLP